MSKTLQGLADYCRAQLGRPYWYGTFGNTATAQLYYEKKAQYPGYYTASDFMGQIGQRVHDCVGLVKGYRWSGSADAVPVYTASQDVNVRGLYAQCGETGAIAALPEKPGLCVFMGDMSHVGVYVGGGWVIEARGHAYGVVKTALSGRGWSCWGRPSWLEDDGGAAPAAAARVTVTLDEIRRGSAGASVRTAQTLLRGGDIPDDSGGDIAVDGAFGPLTEQATRRLQVRLGVAADGVWGRQTWTAALTK